MKFAVKKAVFNKKFHFWTRAINQREILSRLIQNTYLLFEIFFKILSIIF
jgi:hypothetical protein